MNPHVNRVVGNDQARPEQIRSVPARYSAFISYSHQSDAKVAGELQHALQQFAKPYYALRAVHIYRDQTDLAANPALWSRITDALDSSEFFLLLASPQGAQSKWVKREIRHWLERHQGRPDNLLVLWTDGSLVWDDMSNDFDWTRTDSLPPLLDADPDDTAPLRFAGTFREEPMYIDLRWTRKEKHISTRDPIFLDQIATIASELRGQSKSELVGKDVAQHRRARTIRASAVATLTVLTLIATTFGLVALQRQREARNAQALAERRLVEANLARDREKAQREIAEEQRNRAIWQGLVREAPRQLTDGNDELSALLTRQALLFHNLTLEQPKRLVEEMLLRISKLPSFSYKVGSSHSSVAFAEHGARLAFASDEDNGIQLWDLRQPSAAPLVIRVPEKVVGPLAASFDGTRLASGSIDNTIRIWELRRPNAPPLVLKGHEAPLASIAFSRDGTRLASGSVDNTIRLWELRRPGMLPLVLRGHEAGVNSLAFSPDGTRLASSGSYDTTIRLWDLRLPSSPVLVLKGHKSTVESVAFSPNGRVVASCSDDQTILLWDVRQPGTSPLLLKGHDGYILSVAFSPDATRLASGGTDRTIRLWDLEHPGTDALVLDGHKNPVDSLAFSPDGTRLASRSSEAIRLWDLRQPGAPASVLRGNEYSVLSVAYSPDGMHVASGGEDNTIRVWDPNHPNVMPLLLKGTRGSVNSVAFSPESTRLASGSDDSTVRVWDIRQPSAPPQLLYKSDWTIKSVSFSPDGTQVAFGSDTRIRLWDLHNPTAEPRTLDGHDHVDALIHHRK
jgi:WD40 repeat protein